MQGFPTVSADAVISCHINVLPEPRRCSPNLACHLMLSRKNKTHRLLWRWVPESSILISLIRVLPARDLRRTVVHRLRLHLR